MNQLFCHILCCHLGLKDGDVVDIVYKDETRDSFNPYTFSIGCLTDRDGDNIDKTLIGDLVLGNAHFTKFIFPNNDEKAFYVDHYGTVTFINYNDTDPLCRALKAMGNLFPTLKEAEDNVDTIVKLYSK